MFLFNLAEKLFFFQLNSRLFFDISSIFWFGRWLFWLFLVILQGLPLWRTPHSALVQYFWNIIENFACSLIISDFMTLNFPILG